MKVLLLNSPWINDGKVYGIKSGTRWPEIRKRDRTMPYFPFPYEMACTSPYLRKHGIEARFKDAISEEIDAETCLKFLEEYKPGITVIEAFPPSLKSDRTFAREAKRRTGTKIAFCGAHADALPGEVLKYEEVDYVLFGEYEEALRDLARASGDASLIAGVAYKKDGKPVLNPKRAPIANPDEIPPPDMSEVPVLKYTEPLSKRFPGARVMTTRGCPYRCPFCIVPNVHGQGYRRRSMKLVMDEVRELRDRWGIRDIYFDDAFFTVARSKELAQALIDAKMGITWSSWMDWSLTPEDAKLLKKSGCFSLKFGIEAASSEIQKGIGKPVYIERLRKNIREFKKIGLMVHGSFILGLPGETRQTLRETIELVFSSGVTTCQVSVATPLPGTPFYDEVVKNGWLATTDWDQFEGTSTPVVRYPDCGPDDLLEALAEVNRRKVKLILSNPGYAMEYMIKLARYHGPAGFAKEIVKKGRYALGALTHPK